MQNVTRAKVNHQNATNSTGPRSDVGKSRSARNALKHGLTATPPTLIGEDQKKWLQLLHGIIESINPQNYLEQQYAEDLAHQQWKRLRIREYEASRNQMIVHRVNNAHGQHEKLNELREDCERFKSLCKEWKELQQIIPGILSRAPTESVTGGEASCLFETIVTLLDHDILIQQQLRGQVLISAGYRMPDGTDAVIDDVDLLEAISWNRGMLNQGLKHIAKTVRTSVKGLISSLPTRIVDKHNSYRQDYFDSKKELAELERDTHKQNSAAILMEMHADNSENRTIQRLENHSSKQIQQAMQQIAIQRALHSEPASQSNLSVGVAISNDVSVAIPKVSGNTTTEIDGLKPLESADECTFEAASLTDNLRKDPVKALS